MSTPVTNNDLVTLMVALQGAIAEARTAKQKADGLKADWHAAHMDYLNKQNVVRTYRADLELLTEKLTA